MIHGLLQPHHVVRAQYGIDGQIGADAGHAIEDRQLVGLVRVCDLDLEHKSVELRFGKRVSSFLLDRILRGQHLERQFELVTMVAERDLLLLHRFEERLGPWPGRD